MKNDAYLGWMMTEGSGRRKSEKAPESGAVFGDIACDVEVSGISVNRKPKCPTLQHHMQYHQTPCHFRVLSHSSSYHQHTFLLDSTHRLFIRHSTSSTWSQDVRGEVRPERYGLAVSGEITLTIFSVKQQVLFVEMGVRLPVSKYPCKVSFVLKSEQHN